MSDESFILLSRLLAIAAGVIVLMAITIPWIIQRIKKRRRCPKCWYDLSHSPGLQCSECGHTAKRERGLYRAKRARRAVAFALLLAVGGYAAMVTPAVKVRGWPAAVPTTALVIAFPFLRPNRDQSSGEPGRLAARLTPPPIVYPAPVDSWSTALFRELVWMRMPGFEMDGLHAQLLRLGARWNEPAYFESVEPFPRMIDMIASTTRWEDGATPQWSAVMSQPPGPIELTTRPIWVRGEPIYVRAMRLDPPPPMPIERRTECYPVYRAPWGHRWLGRATSPDGMDWHWGGAASEPSSQRGPSFLDRPDGFAIAQSESIGRQTLTFDVVHQQALRVAIPRSRQGWLFWSWPTPVRWETTATETASLSVDVVESIDDILAPLEVPALDMPARGHTNSCWIIDRERVAVGVTGRELRIRIISREGPQALPEGAVLCISAHVEVLHGEQVIAATTVRESFEKRVGQIFIMPCTPVFVVSNVPPMGTEHGEWKIRLTAEPLGALRDFDATHYWDGTGTAQICVVAH